MADINIEELMKNMNGGNKDYSKKQTYNYSNNGGGNNRGGYGNKGGNNYNHNNGGNGYNKNGNGHNNSNTNYSNNSNGRKGGTHQNDVYISSPYNFVPFYDKVVPVEESRMKVHGLISDELLTGEIIYKITAETPVFISDGDKQFAKNEKGEIVIPGSSMRGLIRNNVQILGLSNFDNDIDDYNLMYRNITSGAEKNRYAAVLGATQIKLGNSSKAASILTNVSAGYIAKRGSKYVIYKTVVDGINDKLNKMNYYVLSERVVFEDIKSRKSSFEYLDKHRELLQNIVEEGFKEDPNRPNHYLGVENRDYNPGYHEISYEIKNLKNVSAVGEQGKFKNKGCLVGTGFMKEKKVQYVVPEIDMEKPPIDISDKDIAAFIIDYNAKEKTLGATIAKGNKEKLAKIKKYYNLPDDGEIKPVFYIYLDGRLYFGFTPRLRLFYDYSIKDGYKQNKTDFDYAKSIFGVSDDKFSYKSKVSFTDAKVNLKKSAEEVKVILAGPKPTSYWDYLDQQKLGSTYNTPGFRLRGVKQYWFHKNLVSCDVNEKNANVATTMNPVNAGTEFSGTIRFNNLTKAELGLLLWSIKLNDNSKMNIGMGKPFGYGEISVSDVKVSIFDNAKAYSLDGALSLSPFVQQDASQYISAYKTEVSGAINGKNIDELPHIKDFFMMKDATIIPEAKDSAYMVLKSYQSRKTSLPRVDEVVKKK